MKIFEIRDLILNIFLIVKHIIFKFILDYIYESFVVTKINLKKRFKIKLE